MNTNSKKTFGAVVIAAALLATFNAASAGGQTHVMPIGYGQPHPVYAIEIVTAPTNNEAMVVQVVNSKTGQSVADAHVEMQRPAFPGLKTGQTIRRPAIALQADGHGNFVCASEHHQLDETLTLRGYVSGSDTAVWQTVRVEG